VPQVRDRVDGPVGGIQLCMFGAAI
jgi:hypothetical protein